MKTPVSKEYPTTHLMNPKRKYNDSVSTNVAETFRRIRAQQQGNADVTSIRRVK